MRLDTDNIVLTCMRMCLFLHYTQKLMQATAVGDAEKWLRNLQCS